MLRSFVVDVERNLMVNNDLLGTMCYANQLADAIKNVPNEQAYTIGLYGKWGSGKSTIIRTAKDILEKETKKDIKVVVYDAWKYSGDSFRRMFLLHLREELKVKPSLDMERFYKATTEEVKPEVAIRKKGLFFISLASILSLIAIALVFWLEPTEAKLWVALIFSIISVISISIGGNLFYELKVSQTKKMLFAPEQFEACFMQMMEIVLKKKGWFKQMAHVTEKFFDRNWKSPNLDKLVFVIDNLDRCDTAVVYSMLTDIKTFLGAEKYDVVFVVPMDHDALKKHLFAQRDDYSVDAEEFLRKFFNVVIRLKEHRQDDLLHYINELNRDQKLDFNPDTLSLVAKEYAENPRRIVQMLNNLTVEQSQYDEEFAREHETLIAICMILKEHYSYALTTIIDNPKILKDEEVYKNSAALFQNDENITAKNDDNLRTTLCIAKNILKNAEVKDVRRILINTDNALSNLSGDVLQAMGAYDADAIVSYIQENMTQKDDVCIELLRRIHDEKKYGAVSQIVQWVECVAKINEKCPFEASVLQKIHEEVKGCYLSIPNSVDAEESICRLAKDMDRIGSSDLKSTIMTFVKDPKNDKEELYHKYVSSSFKIFDSKKDCERFSEFGRRYLFNVDDLDQYAFTENHKLHMLGSPFAVSVVSSITSTNQDKAQHQAEWCFRNLSDIKDDVYERLFAQFISLIGPRERKPVTVFMNVVSYAMPILRSISGTTNTEKLSAFYHAVVDKRPNQSNQNVSIVNEVENESAKLLADFCLEMYRVSGEALTINPTLENIQKKCEDYVKNRLIVRSQEGKSMLPFRRNILALDTMDEGWYELIPYAFEKDANGNLIDNTLLKGKLQWIYDNMEDAKALAMLVNLTEDNDVCDLFLTIPDLSNCDTLNNMPVSLLPRIINRYTSDNAEQFKDNNAMLKIVLQNGKSSQKDLVVRSLIDRINNNRDLDGVLDVIDSYDKWRVKDKSVLRDLLQRNMPEDADSELTEMQEKIKSTVDVLK